MTTTFRTTPRTGEINAFLKRSGQALVSAVEENLVLWDKLAAANIQSETLRRERDLLQVALEAVERGHLKASSVREWVSARMESDRTPEHYREVFRLHAQGPMEAVPRPAAGGTKISGASAPPRVQPAADDGKLRRADRFFSGLTE